jgi:hypothetical protein
MHGIGSGRRKRVKIFLYMAAFAAVEVVVYSCNIVLMAHLKERING